MDVGKIQSWQVFETFGGDCSAWADLVKSMDGWALGRPGFAQGSAAWCRKALGGHWVGGRTWAVVPPLPLSAKNCLRLAHNARACRSNDDASPLTALAADLYDIWLKKIEQSQLLNQDWFAPSHCKKWISKPSTLLLPTLGNLNGIFFEGALLPI